MEQVCVRVLGGLGERGGGEGEYPEKENVLDSKLMFIFFFHNTISIATTDCCLHIPRSLFVVVRPKTYVKQRQKTYFRKCSQSDQNLYWAHLSYQECKVSLCGQRQLIKVRGCAD